MKKKQDLCFGGVNKFGHEIVSPSLEMVAMNSTIDPVAKNRKSRRATKKLIAKATGSKTIDRSKSAKNKAKRLKSGRSK